MNPSAGPQRWRRVQVRELSIDRGLVGGPFGSSLGRKDYRLSGVPVIRGTNLAGASLFSPKDFVYVSEAKADDLGRNLAIPGDLVITQRGTLGQVGIVPERPFARYVVSQSQMRLRPDTAKVDSRFLYYVFRSSQMVEQILSRAITTGVPHINLSILGDLEILLPPLAEQRGIAAMLGALDDKIESNRRCVALMVELAQAALLGDGSRAVRLGDVASLDKGVSYKGAGLVDGPSPSARPLVNLGNFPVDSSWLNRSKTKFYRGDYRPRHVVQAGDLVVANTDLTQQRAVLGRATLVPAGLGPALISHHVFAVRFHAREELRLPLWAQLATASARERLTGYATGTTVAGLPKEALLDFMVSPPASGDVIAQAEALVEAAWARESESAALILLRDALLPELLSGRVRVPEASKAVDQALA